MNNIILYVFCYIKWGYTSIKFTYTMLVGLRMNQKLHEQIDFEEGFGRNERWIHADILGIDPRLKNRGERGGGWSLRSSQKFSDSQRQSESPV